MKYADMSSKDVKVTPKTNTVMMDFEFHLQAEEPAVQSVNLLLINEAGEWAIGFNSEDKGFYHNIAPTIEFPNVVYWAYLQRIPAVFERQIITSDEWVNLVFLPNKENPKS